MLIRARFGPTTLLTAVSLLALTLLSGHTAPPARAFAGAPAAYSTSSPTPGDVLVRYRDGTDPAAVAGLEAGLGARLIETINGLGVRVLAVPTGAEDAVVAALSHNPAVAFAERDSSLAAAQSPNDPWWPNEWGPVKTRANSAWDLTTGAPSVVVAVLDTGIDFSQPDLQGKTVAGRDIVNNDADPTDDNGHGTYTAGVVSAATNNSTGVAAYCWACAIMPVKVLGADGSGTTSNVAAGITWATDHGARVINMSLGGTSSSSTLASAVTYAHNHGVVLVAAAGNYGTTALVYPAAYPEVIGVAGTDSNDALYSWSSYGSWVKVAAPGCNLTTGRNAWYGTFCGTSSASPAVAGIAGLAIALAPGATNLTIESAIESTAASIGSSVAYGRVDALGTLQALGGSSPTASPTPTPSPSPTPAPSASASPSPSPTPAPTSTASYRGSLNSKTLQRSYALTVGAGATSAVVEFSGPPTLALTLIAPNGSTVGSVSGASPVTLAAVSTGGAYTWIVADDGTKASFKLTITYPTP